MALILRILSLRKMEMIKLTLVEFEKNFSLHDSIIEKIFYDNENKKLILEIDCCYWFENFDDKKDFINGKISATFENVSYYSYEDYDPSKLFGDCVPEILQTEIDDDGILNICTFEFVRYEPGEDIYPIMKIKAENVEVVELERYDL